MLRVENLTKVYDDGTVALKNVSFEVPEGAFMGWKEGPARWNSRPGNGHGDTRGGRHSSRSGASRGGGFESSMYSDRHEKRGFERGSVVHAIGLRSGRGRTG